MKEGGTDILTMSNVTKRFGGLHAVNDVSLGLPRNKIVALIGPNGAGKTTLFNTIAGTYVPSSGSIQFCGEEIGGKKPHAIARLGIARTFQIVRPFHKMTCLENIMVGAMFGRGHGIGFEEASEVAWECLDFVGLGNKKDIVSENLTLVERKKVEVAKALASDPQLVLLDEPLAGLNPTEIQGAMSLIGKIRDVRGITIFWVEHVMDAVINLAQHVVVLNYGEKIADERPEDLLNNKLVIDAYLGKEYTF